MAEVEDTMFGPFAYRGPFEELQAFHENSEPDEQTTPPVQDLSDSESEENYMEDIMLEAIYSPAIPEERVLSEEEQQRLAKIKTRYFQRGELADGLPIVTRRPTRPRQMSYDSAQTPNGSPHSAASPHSASSSNTRRLLKWTTFAGAAVASGTITFLLLKPKRNRNK